MQFYILVANNSESIGLSVFQISKCKHISILIYIVIVRMALLVLFVLCSQ